MTLGARQAGVRAPFSRTVCDTKRTVELAEFQRWLAVGKKQPGSMPGHPTLTAYGGGGGFPWSVKPWMISMMFPSGSLIHAERNPETTASKEVGPSVTRASGPIVLINWPTLGTLNGM